MTESFFPISNYFMLEKNIENTQFLTLSIHTFLITSLQKSLCDSKTNIIQNITAVTKFITSTTMFLQ